MLKSKIKKPPFLTSSPQFQGFLIQTILQLRKLLKLSTWIFAATMWSLETGDQREGLQSIAQEGTLNMSHTSAGKPGWSQGLPGNTALGDFPFFFILPQHTSSLAHSTHSQMLIDSYVWIPFSFI